MLPRNSVALLSIDVQHSQVIDLSRRVRDAGLTITAQRYDDGLIHAVANLCRLQKGCRSAGIELVHLHCASLTGDGADGSMLFRDYGMPQHGISYDASFWTPVAPKESEFIVAKVSSGAMNGSDLDHLLRRLGIRVLIVAGLVTAGCVETTVRGLADIGYRIILVENACEDWTATLHSNSARVLQRWFATLSTTETVLQALADAEDGMDLPNIRVESTRAPPFAPAAVNDEDLKTVWTNRQSIDMSGAALLLVDLQALTWAKIEGGPANCGPPLAAGLDPAVENCRSLLELFRENGNRVVHTRLVAASYDGRDVPLLMRDHAMWAGLGSEGAAFLPGFEPRLGELVLPRTTFSLFAPGLADQVMRNLGLCHLTIVGIGLETAIASTARDAADRGYTTVVVNDACIAFDPEAKSGTLDALELWYAELVSTRILNDRLCNRR